MTITTTLVPPSRGSAPATFSVDMDTFLSDLPAWTTEANALQADVNSKQSTASTAATNAANSASAASTSATNAANSASAASTSATNAANSASAASTSVTNAANSASAASTSATNAANSASAAAASAASITWTSPGDIGSTAPSTGTFTTLLATSAMGYGTGAGGTVTQATSKATAVTLNKPTGQIATHNAALAADTTVSFLVNNSLVTTSDSVVLATKAGGVSGANYNYWVAAIVAGGFYVSLKNISAGSLSEAVTINFSVIKGATT